MTATAHEREKVTASPQAKPRLVRLALALAACALALLSLAPAAPAAKRIVGTIGEPDQGTLGGFFQEPSGVAVNGTGEGGVEAGTVYILDAVNHRVQQFSPAGGFVRLWGIGVATPFSTEFEICEDAGACLYGSGGRADHPGSLGGQPRGIAVNQATGHVYVAGSGSGSDINRVAVFSATGQPLGAWGWKVNASAPAEELQFCTLAGGCLSGVNPAGGPGGELSYGISLASLAFSPAGEIYLNGPGNRRVDVFEPTIEAGVLTDVAFSRAFGRDVVLTGPGDSAVDERSRLTIRATGGTYTLRASVPGVSIGDVTSIPYNATAGELKAKLDEKLAGAGGSATVTGGPGDETGSAPYEIVFGGTLGGDDVTLEAFKSGLTGGVPSSAAIVETLVDGGGSETCVPADGDACKQGASGTGPGQFRDRGSGERSPTDLTIDPAGNLYTLDLSRGQNEEQELTVDATGGTYTLTFEGETTDPLDPLPHNAFANAIQAALEALPTIGAGNVEVVGGSGAGKKNIRFTGALSELDVAAQISADGSALTGDDPAVAGSGPSAAVQTLIEGSQDAPPRIQRFDPAGNPSADGFGAGALAAAFGPNRQARRIDADPDSSHLLVAGRGVDTAGQVRVLELDGAGDAVDLHGPDLPLTETAGIATAPLSSGGNLYVLSDVPGTLVGAYVLAEDPPLADPPACGPTTATLTGTVFSGGKTVSYRFEYLTEEEFLQSGWEGAARLPVPDAGAGSAPGSIAVGPHTATGLTGSQPYRFSLLASKGGIARRSAAVGCTTAPAVPALSAAGVIADQTAAILQARVNPQNEPTHYRFEYTTEEDFEANGWDNALDAPEPDSEIAAANHPLFVAQEVTGLQAGTAYRARIVAANETGQSAGAEQPFTTLSPFEDPEPVPCPNKALRGGPSALLPDCRAYELVSPPGARNVTNHFNGSVSDDGSHVAFRSLGGVFAEAEQNTQNPYTSHRGASGWTTVSVGAPVTNPTPPSFGGLFNNTMYAFSADFSRVFIAVDSDVYPGPGSLYLHRPGGELEFVGAPPIAGGNTGIVAATSADATHALLLATDGNLYEWVDGAPPITRPANVLPGGGLCPEPRPGDWDGDVLAGSSLGSLSADGRRVFFECDSGVETGLPTRLFVREDGAASREIADPGVFAGASREGSFVFFTTPAALVSGDTNGEVDLYRYDLETGTYARLTPDALGADPDPRLRADKGAVIGRDGSVAYFVARGVLTAVPNANGQSATDGIDNVYAWDRGALRFVASPQTGVTPNDTKALRVSGANGKVFFDGDPTEWDLSPDGSLLAFGTADPLLPADTDSRHDVYVYDLATQKLILATTGPRGGNGDFRADMSDAGSPYWPRAPRSLGAGPAGRFLFFQTAESLLSRDVNDALDVYERNLDTGQTWLISSGASAGAARLIGASEDGSSVAFIDPRPLAPQDPDGEKSVYVARIGGGFPARIDEACVGEACKGEPSAAPPSPRESSATVRGRGNVKTRRCPKGKRRVVRAGKPRCVPRHRKGKSRGGKRRAGQGRAAR